MEEVYVCNRKSAVLVQICTGGGKSRDLQLRGIVVVDLLVKGWIKGKLDEKKVSGSKSLAVRARGTGVSRING